MKKTHFQVHKAKPNKKKQKQKLPDKIKQVDEESPKPDTIYNFYNNINIIILIS